MIYHLNISQALCFLNSTCNVAIDKQILVSRYREAESNYGDINITVNVTWNIILKHIIVRDRHFAHFKSTFLREIDSNLSSNSDLIMIEEATTFNVSTDEQ